MRPTFNASSGVTGVTTVDPARKSTVAEALLDPWYDSVPGPMATTNGTWPCEGEGRVRIAARGTRGSDTNGAPC